MFYSDFYVTTEKQAGRIYRPACLWFKYTLVCLTFKLNNTY